MKGWEGLGEARRSWKVLVGIGRCWAVGTGPRGVGRCWEV